MSDLVLDLALESARYGARSALRAVRVQVRRGEIVGVTGRAGAGKTTLALAAAGLLERASAATIDGTISHPMGGSPPASFVFANPWTQLTELGGTVEEEVAVGPENQALAPAVIRARVDAALARADAARLAARIPRELSGGELQRVALASGLALDAALVVLDEPTAQLDPRAAEAFAYALRALASEGRGVLLVEQNAHVLRAAADRLVVLDDGSIVDEGDPTALLPPESPTRASHAVAAASDVPTLSIRGLHAGYGDREVLRDLTLAVPRGAIAAWMGDNGAGKSTLARAVMGLVAARAGSIAVDGVDLTTLPVERRAPHVGLVFQDPSAQLFARTVHEEVMFGPRALGLARDAALAGAREAIVAVGLEGELGSNPADLTPQAQRRVAIAAAMAARPPLLILDEPTAGQDAEGRAWIARALVVQASRGAAAVITHDHGFAERECSQRVTFAEGQVSNIRVLSS